MILELNAFLKVVFLFFPDAFVLSVVEKTVFLFIARQTQL